MSSGGWLVFVGDWDGEKPGAWTTSEQVFDSYAEASVALRGKLEAAVHALGADLPCPGCVDSARDGLVVLSDAAASGQTPEVWVQVEGDDFVLAACGRAG